jgi:hypothetical protein
MTRRTLLSLPLATLGYEPGIDITKGAITIPSDGDPVQAEVVTEALRELMESSVYVLKRRVRFSEGAIVMRIHGDPGQVARELGAMMIEGLEGHATGA